MYKLLVLCIIIAATSAKPGLLHGAVAAPIIVSSPHVIPPSGVSHQSRHDTVHPGAITVATAHVAPAVAAAPIVAAAPAVRVSSAATTHHDVRGHAVAAVVAAPVVVTHGGLGGSLGGGLGTGIGGVLGGSVGGSLGGGIGTRFGGGLGTGVGVVRGLGGYAGHGY